MLFRSLLMIITFAMLGKNGLLAGIIAFIIAITVSAVLNVESHPEYAIMAILSGTSVIVCSLVASSIYFTQKVVNSKLNESRERENVEKGKVLTLINNITDAIISTDEHGIITMYNSAALNLIDTNNKISGKPIDEILRLETTNKARIDVRNHIGCDVFVDLVFIPCILSPRAKTDFPQRPPAEICPLNRCERLPIMDIT